MRIFCPSCQSALNAPESAVGKSVKCSGCNTVFQIPGLAVAKRPAAPPAPVEDYALAEAVEDPLKPCPFCAEPVKVQAKRCKHCGETLDAAMRSAEEAKTLAKMASRRGGDVSVSQSVTVRTGGFPHVLHLVITVCTCGLWLPVWITHYIIWACTR